jgi:hypothetical protein
VFHRRGAYHNLDSAASAFGLELYFVVIHGLDLVFGKRERDFSRITSRFTSNARLINHFESAESRSEVQPMVLRRCFVYRGLTRTADLVDRTRSRRSEQIGMDRFWKSSGRVRAGWEESSEQIVSNVRAKFGLNAVIRCC